ncbi:MAG: glycosyltransferase [Victivallaceae bacterium]|nr:glycosyltransferase [Victivallaceae bacterium]
MKDPVVSVIVPVYNVEAYVARSLDSLLVQTLPEIEIVCVNDGSTDGSREILERYARQDSRIRIFDRPNGGLSAARNTGLEHVTGRYVMFLDSDDFFGPRACEEAFLAMETNASADLAGFGVRQFELDPAGNEVSAREIVDFPEGVIPVSLDMEKRMFATVWNKIFKREMIDRYQIRFPEGLLFEDICFLYCYLMYAGFMAFTGRVNYHYFYKRPGSIMDGVLSYRPLRTDYFDGVNVCLRFYQRNKLLRKAMGLLKYYSMVSIESAWMRTAAEDLPELDRIIRKFIDGLDAGFLCRHSLRRKYHRFLERKRMEGIKI